MDKLRKHFINKRPQHVPSATLLAKAYGVSTTQVTKLLKQLGYEQATDNSGWYLPVGPSVPNHPLYLSQAKWDELAELVKDLDLEEMESKLQKLVASGSFNVTTLIRMTVGIAIKRGVTEIHLD